MPGRLRFAGCVLLPFAYKLCSHGPHEGNEGDEDEGSPRQSTGLKKSEVTQVLSSLADIGATEVKKTGKFVLPGLVMIKTRTKAATKAGKRVMFGKEMTVKVQPAKTVVKAYPVKAVKDQF